MTQISVTPTWIQILSGLLMPLIAIITVTILILQYILAKQRWRLDLYDKRYPVFSATMEYIGYIVKEKKITDEEWWKFLRNSKDKVFLFGEDVQQFLKELYERGSDFRIILKEEEKLDADFVNQKAKLVDWFSKQFGVSIELFKKYLAIDKK